jgi:hypothetical protein
VPQVGTVFLIIVYLIFGYNRNLLCAYSAENAAGRLPKFAFIASQVVYTKRNELAYLSYPHILACQCNHAKPVLVLTSTTGPHNAACAHIRRTSSTIKYQIRYLACVAPAAALCALGGALLTLLNNGALHCSMHTCSPILLSKSVGRMLQDHHKQDRPAYAHFCGVHASIAAAACT